MIQNIILLLAVNTIAPYIFVPPALLAPLPLAQVFLEPPSVLQSMNLSRLYSSSQFRQAFRQSLKVHHPDHGGSQEVFQQIQGLKKIMSKQVNYYDLYNLTDADISATNIQIEEAVAIKKYTYYVETGIFYFITCLYVLVFTLDSDLKAPRFISLGLTVAFLLYELCMHQYPMAPTFIDLIYNKLPLFTQRKFIKRALIIWIALVRVHFSRRRTEEEQLLGALREKSSAGAGAGAEGESLKECKSVLQRLLVLNRQKFQEKKRYQNSWSCKIRNWISKGISILFLLLIIKNLIPGLNLL